jgi:hypothetical protein
VGVGGAYIQVSDLRAIMALLFIKFEVIINNTPDVPINRCYDRTGVILNSANVDNYF